LGLQRRCDVIVTARDVFEHNALASFLQHYAYVQPTGDMILFGWVTGGALRMVTALNGFIGSVCQIHVASVPGFGYCPREMLAHTFVEAFWNRGVKQLLGVVNSKNVKAMRFDKHLGFKEITRLPQMHDDGGDLVLLGMKVEDCRYLPLEEIAA
jgi:L-amino acid N-acyltransferase YncA